MRRGVLDLLVILPDGSRTLIPAAWTDWSRGQNAELQPSACGYAVATLCTNSDLLKTAEASPDTMLTLISGEKLIVRETCDEVTQRVLVYRARLLAAVAAELKLQGGFERAAGIASLDLSARCELPAHQGTERPHILR